LNDLSQGRETNLIPRGENRARVELNDELRERGFKYQRREGDWANFSRNRGKLYGKVVKTNTKTRDFQIHPRKDFKS